MQCVGGNIGGMTSNTDISIADRLVSKQHHSLEVQLLRVSPWPKQRGHVTTWKGSAFCYSKQKAQSHELSSIGDECTEGGNQPPQHKHAPQPAIYIHDCQQYNAKGKCEIKEASTTYHKGAPTLTRMRLLGIWNKAYPMKKTPAANST